MARRRRGDLAVGAMAALALVILAVAIMAVGGESSLFSKQRRFRVVFPSVVGLVAGSPVKISGVQVGTVQRIRLSPDPAQTGIEVELGISESYAALVRDDSRASLGVLQMLSGEKFVKISPGTVSHPALEPGSVIVSQQDRQIFEQASEVADNFNEITVSLKNILSAMERGEGLIGQALMDPEFGQEGLQALRGSLENMQALTGDMLAGKGFVGRLLYDEPFSHRIDDLGAAIEDLAVLIGSIDLEQGAVGELLAKDGAGQRAVENLSDTSESVKVLGECLASEDGLLRRLVCDPDVAESLVPEIQRVVRNLAEITDKINRGEGTLGALINDRSVYDGMEDVMAGVGNSKFARWLLRHYQKKGIKLEDADEHAEETVAEESPSGSAEP